MQKKSFGLQTIDQQLTNLLRPLFHGSKKEFILINNLVKNWEEIIGKKYAKSCYPKLVSFNKGQSNSGKLTIAVHNPTVGFFLDNNSEMIIERIASFYGFKSIAKIIIKQEPKNPDHDKAPQIQLPQPQENFLQEKISKIEDEDLAKILKKLGREILNAKSF